MTSGKPQNGGTNVMKKGFIFYASFLEALKGLPPDSYIRLSECILIYGITGEETELQGLERNIFATIRAQIDESYAEAE